MQSIVTDGLAQSDCWLVVSPAKTGEPIEVPFGLWTQVGPGTMY